MIAIILILVYTLIGFVVGVRNIRTILSGRKVRFMNLEYTKRELRKFSWEKVAKLELDIYDEIRSPRALESRKGVRWQNDHDNAVKRAEAEVLERLHHDQVSKERLRLAELAQEAIDKQYREAQKAFLSHLQEKLAETEAMTGGVMSAYTCKQIHGQAGVCVHHFSDPPRFNVLVDAAGRPLTDNRVTDNREKACVKCERDHSEAAAPSTPAPAPNTTHHVPFTGRVYVKDGQAIIGCTGCGESWDARWITTRHESERCPSGCRWVIDNEFHRSDAMEVMGDLANNYTEGGSNTVVTHYSGSSGGGSGGSGGSVTIEPWPAPWQVPEQVYPIHDRGRRARRGEPVDGWGKPVRRATLKLKWPEASGVTRGCCCSACASASQLVSSEHIGSVFTCYKCQHTHEVIAA
jgi:hypothetical protein